MARETRKYSWTGTLLTGVCAWAVAIFVLAFPVVPAKGAPALNLLQGDLASSPVFERAKMKKRAKKARKKKGKKHVKHSRCGKGMKRRCG
jgi:hypothetical protein